MAITTYSELKTSVADFLNRDDLTSAIPTFISLAEAQIARDVRSWRQEKRVETTLDERYELLPSDFLEAKRLELDSGEQLRLIATEDMSKYRQENNVAAKPRFYSIATNQFEFYPSPTGNETLSLVYAARVPALSDEEPTNWILELYPDVYLYGALIHSAGYLQEDARSGQWAQLYGAAVSGVNMESDKARYSGGSLVMRVK
jgi:hypothetical protein